MPSITSENVANAIVKLVAVDALPALLGEMVVGNLIHRNFEATVAQVGDVADIYAYPKPISIPLKTHAEATFQIPDITKVLAIPDLLRLYMQPAVSALAEKIETDLLCMYPQFTGNQIVGLPGTSVTEAVIEQAEITLFNQKVPASESKYLVVDGATYSALRKIPRFSEYHTVGEAGLRALIDGPIGKIHDFYVFRSQHVRKTGLDPVTTHNLAFTKNSIGLVMRRLPQPLPGTGAVAEYAELGNFGIRVVMSYNPSTLAQQFTIDVLYGVAALNDCAGVQVQS